MSGESSQICAERKRWEKRDGEELHCDAGEVETIGEEIVRKRGDFYDVA